MVIGSGFVRSGSGFVSTPATRAAARAAGTFGPEGYEGATLTSTRLIAAQTLGEFRRGGGTAQGWDAEVARRAAAAAAAAAKPCPTGNEYKPIYPNVTCPIGYWKDIRSDGLWCVCDMWKSKMPTVTPPSTTPPPPPPTTCFDKCNSLIGIPILYNACLAACHATVPPTPSPTPTPTPTPPPAPPTECLSGLYYDAVFYKACEAGYTEYSLKGHNKCVCIAKLAEAKAEVDSLYVEEEGDALGDLGKYTPYLLLAAVAGVALSLIKK